MSPNPLLPKGVPPWLAAHRHSPGTSQSVLTEEQLADYHAKHLNRMTWKQTLACLIVLSIAAAVVILPFIYMLMISMKSPAEIGNGRFFPDEFHRARGRTAVIQIDVTAEDVVRLVSLDKRPIPVQPIGDAPFSPWPEPKYLPAGTRPGTRLNLNSDEFEAPTKHVLIRVPDPKGEIAAAGHAQVYIPVDDLQSKWLPVVGTARPWNFSMRVTRLLQNYRRLLNWDRVVAGNWLDWFSKGYPRWYFNSLFVAISTVILGVFLDSMAAFGFAKFKFPFQRSLFVVLLATLMIPYPVTLVPTFFIFAKLGFYNTYAALILPGVVSAFGIFLVRQYMKTIPDDMLDAARVDGANDFQVYWQIVMPASRPVLAALAVFRFIYQWNTYLFPLVLINKDSMKTVQLGIATMEDMHGRVDFGMQMAGSALAVIPILVVYMFMQKHFITGITMGTAKG